MNRLILASAFLVAGICLSSINYAATPSENCQEQCTIQAQACHEAAKTPGDDLRCAQQDTACRESCNRQSSSTVYVPYAPAADNRATIAFLRLIEAQSSSAQHGC